MLPYITRVYVLVDSLIGMAASTQSCKTGWFGFNCMLKCHCKNSHSCSMDGQCPNKGPCEAGFFGPACQYVIARLTTPTAPYLLDNNDSTCNANRFAKSVELTLSSPIPFSWYRVVFNNDENTLDFDTTLNTGKPCDNEMKYKVSDSVVDVMCLINDHVKKLIITGHIASSVCSVYINAGRNVALKQQTYQTSNLSVVVASVRAENAVDGNTNSEFSRSSCTHTASEVNGPEWYLTYHRPMVLYTIRVYNRKNYAVRLMGFNLVTYNEDRIVTNNLTAPLQVQSVYDFTLPKQEPVAFLRIKGSTIFDPRDRYLAICEAETYGDSACAEDFYGLFCHDVCNCSRNDICSPVTGLCAAGCTPGSYGPKCLHNCSEQCLDGYCKFVSGQCVQCVAGFTGDFCTEECLRGSYGIRCASHCSDHCTDVCDHATGTCICEPRFTGARCEDCEAGLFNNSCNLNCPKHCKDSICNRTTGYCVKCNGHRFGDFCEECLPGQYGLLCDLKCSHGCLNGTCEADSGHCFPCNRGFTGNICAEDAKEKINWIDKLPLLLPFIITWPCCLWFCLSRTRQTMSDQSE